MQLLNRDDEIIFQDMEDIYYGISGLHCLKNSAVYLTGATGMLGMYITLFLLYLNDYRNFNIKIFLNVRNREKLRNRLGERVKEADVNIVEGDVSTPIDDGIMADYIIHAASLASPQYYGKYPVETMLPNILGTNEILKLAKRSKSKSVVFISSGSVYGKVYSTKWITEDTVGILDWNEMGNAYGESKRCGETLCRAYSREYNIPVKTVRVHHTYGPTMDYKCDRRVFADFVNSVMAGKDIVLRSKGDEKRAFSYITDTVRGIFAVFIGGIPGETYNIANTRQFVTIAELANKVAEVSQSNIKVVYQERPKEEEYCPSSVKRMTEISTEKIEKLGWKPNVSIEEGFDRTLRYLRSNK